MKRFGIASPAARKKAGAGKKAGKSPLVSLSPASPLATDLTQSPKAGPFSLADQHSGRPSTADAPGSGHSQAPRVVVEEHKQPWETEDIQVRAPRPAILQPTILLTDPAATTVLFTEDSLQRLATEAHENTQPRLKKYSTEMPQFPMSYDEFLSTIDGSHPDRGLDGMRKWRKNTDVEFLKQQAVQREQKRKLRFAAAVKIQALIRGFLARRRFSSLQEDLGRMRRRHQLAQLRRRVQRSWAPYRIYKALKAWTVRQKTRRAGLFQLFQHHCAVSIQKIYRGFRVRKTYCSLLGKRSRGRARLKALITGWKTRRILKFRKVRNVLFELKEMMALTQDKNHALTASDLFDMINQQIPVLKAKFWDEFERLYRSGKWVEKPIKPISRPAEPISVAQEPEDVPEPVYVAPLTARRGNRDDIPVSGLKIDYSQIDDQGNQQPDPKPVQHHFLKKSAKGPSSSRPKQHAFRRFKQEEKSEDEETRDKSPHSIVAEDIVGPGDIEEARQEDDRAPQPFLKRRSQAVQAQKLSWNVRSRIDCWGQKKTVQRKKSPVQSSPKVESRYQVKLPESPTSPRVKPFAFAALDLSPVRKSKLEVSWPVEQLEEVFHEIEKTHVPISKFFKRNEGTSLPQFQPDSYFVTHYTDEIYPVHST